MFADKIGEICSTTGTGTFSLGGAYSNFRTWSAGFATGSMAFYLATNDTGTIWEIGYGTFTAGSPDTLTRTLIASSSGSPINWVTTPYRIYSVPNAAAMKHMLAPLVNGVANVPAWLPAGALWLDYALGVAVAWVKKTYISGTRTAAASHAEEGRFYLAGGINIFAASQRALFVDIGAANYVFTAADVGKVLAFSTTGGARTLTMLTAAAAGMGHGAYVDVYPYSTAPTAPAGVTFTPGGADTTTLATAPANRITRYMWDGARSTWVADYAAPSQALYPKGTITGLTYGDNSGDATNDIDIAAGECMDATGAYRIAVAALTKRSDATWAVGNNQGALDTGVVGDSDYYIWAIARSDTGVTDILFALSPTGPTMPANYDYKRLIGWFARRGGTIVAFHTYETEGGGIELCWDAPTLDINISAALTTARRLDALKLPHDFATDALVTVAMVDATNAFLARVCSPVEADGAPSTTAAPLANMIRDAGGTDAVGEFRVRTDSSGRIAARATLATVDTYAAVTNGFRWSRR